MTRTQTHALILCAMIAGPASAQASPPDSRTPATHDAHGTAMFSMVSIEAGYAGVDGGLWALDVNGWVGGDIERVWVRFRGETRDGTLDSAEAEAFYGWNVDPFWDVLLGLRQDFEPDGETWLAAGIAGLAPYFIESEATLFLSTEGDAALRIEQSFDLLLTQRLIAEPHAELNVYAQDMPWRGIGAGLSDIEAGIQLRYEITRKFSPFIEIVWERDLGETAGLTRAAGEDVEETTIRFGLRGWF